MRSVRTVMLAENQHNVRSLRDSCMITPNLIVSRDAISMSRNCPSLLLKLFFARTMSKTIKRLVEDHLW